VIEGVENVQNNKKGTTLYSRRTQYVHKPLPFDSLPSVSFQCKTFRTMLVRVRADLNS
jgi:hypothetical protein